MLTSSSWFSSPWTAAPDPDPVETAASAEAAGEALEEGLWTKFWPTTEEAAAGAVGLPAAPAVTVTVWVTVTGPEP